MDSEAGQLSKRFAAIRSVLEHREFRLFSFGNFMSLTSIWIVRVCVAWLTWELTNSKTWLGVMAFAELGPSILVSLYSGPLADRRNKFAILRTGQWIQFFLALALAGLSPTGELGVWAMLALMFGYSVIGGLTLPARLAIAPTLVEKSRLAAASAIGSVTLNLTRLLGPLLAAPLIIASLEGMAFLLAAVGFLANALSLAAIRRSEAPFSPPALPATEAGYGALFRFLGGDRRLWLVLVLQFLLWLSLRPLYDLLPAFAGQVFHTGEQGYAALVSAVGVGSLLGAFYATGRDDERGMQGVVIGCAMAAALVMPLFGVMTSMWLALPLLAVHGATVTASGIAATTFIQMQTPKDMLGRIMSLYTLVFRFAPAVGALLYGLAADHLGLPIATALLAVIAALSVLMFRRQMCGVENMPAR